MRAPFPFFSFSHMWLQRPEPGHTSVHWHSQRLPNGMDGVAGLTQPRIPPGKTFVYEFTARRPGTFTVRKPGASGHSH